MALVPGEFRASGACAAREGLDPSSRACTLIRPWSQVTSLRRPSSSVAGHHWVTLPAGAMMTNSLGQSGAAIEHAEPSSRTRFISSAPLALSAYRSSLHQNSVAEFLHSLGCTSSQSPGSGNLRTADRRLPWPCNRAGQEARIRCAHDQEPRLEIAFLNLVLTVRS